MPKKIRSDKKLRDSKYQGSIPSQPPLTKKCFEALLTKSAQPLKPDSKVKGTTEFHLSDGCTDKCTSQDKTISKEADLPLWRQINLLSHVIRLACFSLNSLGFLLHGYYHQLGDVVAAPISHPNTGTVKTNVKWTAAYCIGAQERAITGS